MTLSRRDFTRTCVLGAAAFASLWEFGVTHAAADTATGRAQFVFPLDQDWLFAGKFNASSPKLDESALERVNLPHCVTKLSWENWDPASWETVWLYRKHFKAPNEALKRRVFVHFDGVMTTAKPVINGVALPEHQGGYLPFQHEITQWLNEDDNTLDVAVDARWQSVPPQGKPKGTRSVDYLMPGGINRSVQLCVLPEVFISDVFAKPVNVLTANRMVEIRCYLNATRAYAKPFAITVELRDGGRVVATATQNATVEIDGETEVKLKITNLGGTALWELDAPKLYEVVTTLSLEGKEWHEHKTRIGFREAKFTTDGFFLNGKRVQLFGLDRHEIYPYVGGAMPPRVMRKDAQILKRDFNCNVVRCSHYPQTEAFLDACDELGLMVWQETPGWGYLGNQQWRDQVVDNVRDMIRRDRNHPAIIIWGVRVNESANDQTLYRKTTALAAELDGSRQTSGSMTGGSRRNWKEEWHQDVFAYDDYGNAKDGSVGIEAPTAGVPYMLAETVGQFSYGEKGFNNRYRRAGDLKLQTNQAIFHAEAHDRAARTKANSGAIAWCGFDYASLMNPFNTVKCPGVADVFRIPKLGASFYLAQVSPAERVMIVPDFYWDFGPKTPRGPGKHAAIFSNCERLEVFVGGNLIAKVEPDRANFPHLKYAPFFCDLDLDGASNPELRIDGYVGGKLALSKSLSADAKQDQLLLAADDAELMADGADATRVVFKVADKFGSERAFAEGQVTFELAGPGVIVGDNPFDLKDSGGVGAVWIKTMPNQIGTITLTATMPSLGKKSASIEVKAVKQA